jgi:dolichol-phosphate mannosyltransferase
MLVVEACSVAVGCRGGFGLRMVGWLADQPKPGRCVVEHYDHGVQTVVVVPTYNEVENIERFLRAVRTASPTIQVLVVDDASPDGSADVARLVAAELGGIEVLVRDGDRGLGNAYREGFEHVVASSAAIIVSMDADLSHDPAAIGDLVAAVTGDIGMVIGSRYVPGGRVVNWPAHRRWLSRWGNRYTALALGLRARDCTSGFRAYRREALIALEPSTTTAEGYAFLTELVRRAHQRGIEIGEVPITFVDRRYGTSKMSGRIIVESMARVTKWAVTDRWAARRSRG